MSHYANDSDTAAIRAALDVLDRRERFVAVLADGPLWKRDLQDELDVSRSTVYKAIRDLEELGLVERRDDGYDLSIVGRRLYERRQQFHEVAAEIYDPVPFLSGLPTDIDLPEALFLDAELVSGERFAPNRPVRTIERLVRETESLKGLTPVVLPQYVDTFHERLISNELRAELLLERPVLEHLVTEYEGPFEEAVAAGDLAIYTTDERLAYGLLLLEAPDRRVVFIAYGPGGNLRGLIINESPAAIEWAETTWERHRSAAERTCRTDG